MRALTRTLLAGGVAATFLAAPAATAATNCFGPRDMYFCLVTPSASLGSHTECVYLGGTSCQNVTVPIVELNGELTWYCGGVWACVSPR